MQGYTFLQKLSFAVLLLSAARASLGRSDDITNSDDITTRTIRVGDRDITTGVLHEISGGPESVAQFNDMITQTEVPVFVFFHSPNCRISQQMIGTIARLAQEHKRTLFIGVDTTPPRTQVYQAAVGDYYWKNALNVPAFKLFKNGQPLPGVIVGDEHEALLSKRAGSLHVDDLKESM